MRTLTLVLLLACMALCSGTLTANSWNGHGDTNSWFDAGNWSDNTVPGPGDAAYVGNGFTPFLPGPVTVGSLVLDNASLGGPGSMTVTGSFSADSASSGVPLILLQGCAGLLTGYYSLSNDLTNYGELTCSANVTFFGYTIINYGTFNAISGYGFNVYYSPARFFNHGVFKKPFPAGSFNAGVEVTNFSDGDIVAEMGELNISGGLINYGDVQVSAGATVRNHEVHAKDGSTITGAGTFIINGNGFFAENSTPISVDIAELVLDGQQIGGSGAVTITQHLNWVEGGIQTAVTFSPTCVVDVNTAGGHGIVNTTTNNGIVNISANMTFSSGTLVNNNLITLNGAHAIGVYNASAGIFNHGTVKKPASEPGLFTLNLPLINATNGTLLVQNGELYCGQLENSGAINISAGATIRTYTLLAYDGATFTGAGLLIMETNGLYAYNTSPISIDVDSVQINSQGILGTGTVNLTKHIVWTSGGMQTTVNFQAGSVVDVNPGSGTGVTGTLTNYGTLNINANMTFSYGFLTNYGLVLLNGPFAIGIYAGTQGIVNHGTVKKPAGSTGTFNMGIPLINHTDGSVIVENGELYVNSEYSAYGSLSVSAGAIFRANSVQVYDGASFSGAGNLVVAGNGLNANNTGTVIFDIATVDLQSSCSGTGTLYFNGLVNWTAGYINCNLVIGTTAAFNVNVNGFYGIGASVTVNGTMEVNALFFNNGTIHNNGTTNLNVPGVVGGDGLFDNTGLLKKTVAAGDVTIQHQLQNSGTVQCLSDHLVLLGLANAGNIEISAGALVQLDGYGNNSFDAGGTLSGDGTFTLSANLTVNADASIDVQTFNLEGYYGLSGGSTLTFNHTLNWNAAQIENPVIIAAGAVLNLAGADAKYLLGTLTNNGTVNCDASLELGFSALLVNNGAFHLNGDNTLGAPYGYYVSGQIDNAGTLEKSSAGTAQCNLFLNNHAGGSLLVDNGTLEVGKLDNAGDVSVANGATLVVKDGSNLGGGTLSGAGTVRIAGSGWTITNPLTISTLTLDIDGNLYGVPGASLDIQGTASWLSGNISVPVQVANGGIFNVSGYGYRVLQATLSNAGTVNCATSFSATADITNQGTFNLTDGGGFFGNGGQTFNNSGALNMNSAYDAYIGMPAVNTGTIEIASATLHFFNGLQNNAAVNIQAGATLGIDETSGFNAGSTLTGAGSVNASGELTLQTDLVFSGETFSLNADLLGPNTLTINSNMTWGNGNIQTNVTIAQGATLVIGGNGGGGGGGFDKAGAQAKSSSFGPVLSATINNHGTTTQNGYYSMDGGVFSSDGQLNTAGGGIQDDGNGGTLTNNGTWTSQYDFNCQVNAVNNGTFNGEGNQLNFVPDLQNNGVVSPGFSPGQMVFTHNYTNGAELDIQVESAAGPGIGHDYVEAEENIQLGGALVVTETGSPLSGDYTIMHCTGGPNCLSGTFAATDLPTDYSVTYTGDAVILTKGGQQASIAPADTAICAGSEVTLTASTGDAYQWSTGETTASITVAPYYTSTYTVTVTYAGGGGAFTSATVHVNPQPYVGIDPWYSYICQGESLTLTAFGGDTYTWSTNESGASIVVSPNETTSYYVTATDANGCTNAAGTYIYVGDPAAVPAIDGVPASICQNESAVSLPTYEDGYYGTWSGPGVQFETFDPGGLAGNQVLTFTPYAGQCGAPATWTIEVTVPATYYLDADNDGYGDPNTAQTACIQPAGYTSDNSDCDDNNAAVNPGATEVCNGIDDDCDGLTDEGVGTVWYADADNDGYGNAAVTTTACTQPAGYVSNNTDCNDNNASVHPNATEVCNGIDDDCDGLTDEGLGTVWYADADNDGYGNAAVMTTACTQPAGYVSNNTDCNDNNASVRPNATEVCNGIDDDCDGLTDEGLGTVWYADADNDGYGNAAVTTTACTQPEGYVSNNTDCNDNNAGVHPGATEVCNSIDDDCDGQVDENNLGLSLSAGAIPCGSTTTTLTATASGGFAPYQYSLDGGSFVAQNTFTVTAGNHSVQVLDAHGCMFSSSISVSGGASGILIAPILVTHVACGGGNTGAIDITVSGGTAPYTYHWSNNKTTQDITSLAANTYTVTVTASGGCSATASATVNAKLKLTMSKTNTVCNGGSDGTATATATEGTPPYAYAWNTGALTSTITGLTPGTYSATITDALGCTRTGSATVAQPAAIAISSQATAVSCFGGSNGSVSLSISNGTAPYTFAWSDGGTSEDRNDLPAGTFTVTVTDVNGCTRSKSFTLTQPTALTLGFAVDNVTCHGAGDGGITATVNGGTKFPTTGLCNGERYCFNWSNNATSRIISGLIPTTYTLTATDAKGCSISGSAEVTEPDVLQITNIAEEALTNGKYKLTITAAGGVTPYKYKRVPGTTTYQTSNVFTNVPAGAYLIIVRDKNLCEDTVSVNVPGAGNFQRGAAANRALLDQVPAETLSESGDGVLLYPNPASRQVNVLIDSTFTSGSIQIFDLNGRLVLDRSLSPDEPSYRFDLSGWPGGLYLVHIRTDAARRVQKLVVETP